MAGHVKQQRVTEWGLIDGGNISRSPGSGRAGFHAAHARHAF